MILFLRHIFISSAIANPPTIEMADDGSVKVSCVIDAPLNEVRGAIADPLLMMDFTDDLKIQQNGWVDRCRIIDYRTTWSNYKVKMCPIGSGFNFDLISSATLSAFWTRWRFHTHGSEGKSVRVEYQIMVKPKIPLPRTVMQNRLKKDVDVFFKQFQGYFD